MAFQSVFQEKLWRRVLDAHFRSQTRDDHEHLSSTNAIVLKTTRCKIKLASEESVWPQRLLTISYHESNDRRSFTSNGLHVGKTWTVEAWAVSKSINHARVFQHDNPTFSIILDCDWPIRRPLHFLPLEPFCVQIFMFRLIEKLSPGNSQSADLLEPRLIDDFASPGLKPRVLKSTPFSTMRRDVRSFLARSRPLLLHNIAAWRQHARERESAGGLVIGVRECGLVRLAPAISRVNADAQKCRWSCFEGGYQARRVSLARSRAREFRSADPEKTVSRFLQREITCGQGVWLTVAYRRQW